MTTACIIQARMGSTRLPGKVLLPLGETTVLGNVIERCQNIAGIDQVCVAIPDTAENDKLERWIRGRYGDYMHEPFAGMTLVRGPEHDVLERYRIAADTLGADTVMRITSDCPLIDPVEASRVLRLYSTIDPRLRRRPEFVANDMGPKISVCRAPIGMGVEVFSIDMLRTASLMAAAPEDREHVSPWMTKQTSFINDAVFHINLSKRRWTIDTPEDYERVKAIYARLPAGRLGWSWIETMRAEDGL